MTDEQFQRNLDEARSMMRDESNRTRSGFQPGGIDQADGQRQQAQSQQPPIQTNQPQPPPVQSFPQQNLMPQLQQSAFQASQQATYQVPQQHIYSTQPSNTQPSSQQTQVSFFNSQAVLNAPQQQQYTMPTYTPQQVSNNTQPSMIHQGYTSQQSCTIVIILVEITS